jgi:uncharacterized protein YndB with AHSA1/START domain
VGAITIAGTWRTTAAPPDVWDVIVDLRTWPRWWPAIRHVEPVAGDDHAPDVARFTFDTPSPLRPVVVELTVTDRADHERLVVTATDGPLTGTGAIDLTAIEDGTATDYDLSLRVRSLLFRPVERVLGRAASNGGRERLRRAGDDLAVLAGGEPLDHEV